MGRKRAPAGRQLERLPHGGVTERLMHPVTRAAERGRKPPHELPSMPTQLTGQKRQGGTIVPERRQLGGQPIQRVVPGDLGPASRASRAVANERRLQPIRVIHRLRQRLSARAAPALRDRVRRIAFDFDEASIDLTREQAAPARALEAGRRVELLYARDEPLFRNQDRNDLARPGRRARVEQDAGCSRDDRALEKFSSFHI